MYTVNLTLGDGSHSIDGNRISSKVLTIAIVDDSLQDAKIVERHLHTACHGNVSIEHFTSLNDFLADDVTSPDVVILDRMMPDSILGEARIREIRAKHNGCGVVLHTGNITPSLRSTAAHEGAMAVVEKGTLDAEALKLLVMSAAAVGPKMKLQQH